MATELDTDSTVPCGHTEDYEEIGQTPEGMVIVCSYCGCGHTDTTRPKVYTTDENMAWYWLYRQAYFAVKDDRACWWDDKTGHRPCHACYEDNRARQEERIRGAR